MLLTAAVLTTGQTLQVRPLALPLVLVTLLGVQGIGFAMAGLALVVKRIGGISGLLPLAFVGLAIAPLDEAPALKVLPLGLGARLVRRLLVDGVPPAAGDLVVLVVSSACWRSPGCWRSGRWSGSPGTGPCSASTETPPHPQRSGRVKYSSVATRRKPSEV